MNQPDAEALAVKDGTILAVGSRVEIDKLHKGNATRVVDLGWAEGRQVSASAREFSNAVTAASFCRMKSSWSMPRVRQ